MQRKILPLLLFSLLALTGCSCQQRLERLQRRCPDCFTQTTAHVRDTLTVPETILTGSVPWAWLPSGDTVLLENRDITLQLLLEGDTLRADVTVPPDTLYIDRKVAVPCPECNRLRLDVAVAVALLALLFLWGLAREVRLLRKHNDV